MADKAEIYVDRRLVPGEDPQDAFNEIKAIAEQAIQNVPGTTVEVTLSDWAGAATEAPVDDPLVQAMIGANARLGLSTEPTGFSMATDGRFFARAGYPTIVYGPGDPSLAHKPNEWVGIDEIMDATRAYAIAMVRLIGEYEK